MMNPVHRHFRGTIDQLTWTETGHAVSGCDAVDLRTMAGRAMNYYFHNPMPELNYACRFSHDLLACPPAPRVEDLVAHGDTDVRMLCSLYGLRQITGMSDESHIDEGIHRRVVGYIGDDGLSYSPFASSCSPEMPAETILGNVATTGWTIRALAERYAARGDESARKTAHRMSRTLKGLAEWETGRAYYPGFQRINGKWQGGVFGVNATISASEMCHLLHYSTTCGDDEITEFASDLARGVVAGLPGDQVLGARRFREDGSFTDHSYLQMHSVWGVAMAGRVQQDPVLLEWARKVYEFVRSRGTDYGWFPERMILPGEHPYDGYEERVDVSETCVTGEMIQTAAELALAGYSHYWDHVDRYVRNYLGETQFVLTPRIERFYRERNKDHAAKDIELGIAALADYEGGFFSDVSVNDIDGVMGPLSMAGCCVPGGTAAIITGWRNTVTRTPDGIRVNLAFPHDGTDGRIEPGPGTLRVHAAEAGPFLLRPPAWTERGKVQALRGHQPVAAPWKGDYILFADVRPGETLEIRWPTPSFQQRVQAGGRIGAERPYTFEWTGNTLLRVRPAGSVLPLFKVT